MLSISHIPPKYPVPCYYGLSIFHEFKKMENLSVVFITQAIIHCHSFMTYKITWMGIIVCPKVWITHNTTVLVIWVIRWPKKLLPLIQTLLFRLATIRGSVSCQDSTDMLLFFFLGPKWLLNEVHVHNLINCNLAIWNHKFTPPFYSLFREIECQ